MPETIDYTTIPIQVMANLRNLSAEEFKMIGALCYLNFNQHQPSASIEQIERHSGIITSQLKPVIQRLIRRGWLLQTGNWYRLAFKHATHAADANAPDTPLAATAPPTEFATPPKHYDAALGIRPPRVTIQALYPEGPWLTDRGLLDEDFIRDRAQVWQTGDHSMAKSFGAMAMEDVMGVVCKHYAKSENHGNLEIDWHSYCAKNQRYLANIQQRLQSGAQIQADEQASALKKLYLVAKPSEVAYEAPRAITANTAPTEPLTIEQLPIEPRLTKSLTIEPRPTEPTVAMPNALPPPSTTPDRPAADRPQPSPLDRLSNMIRPIAPSLPRVEPYRPIPMTPMEKLRLWLADPILRVEAARTAANQGYRLVYNDYGIPIDLMLDDEDIDF
jgi:hypothetical protein